MERSPDAEEGSDSTWRAMVQTVRPFWVSEWRWKALGLLIVLLATVVGFGTWFAVWQNEWQGNLTEAIANRDGRAIHSLLRTFVGIVLAAVCLSFVHRLAESTLKIRWRSWLVDRVLDRWLSDGNAFYAIEQRRATDNPDQRISEDIVEFIDLNISLSLDFLRSAASLVTFVTILWTLSGSLPVNLLGSTIEIPGYMVIAAALYATGTTWLTHLVGAKLMPLTYAQQRLEADFRYRMAVVRENAEQIASYGGGRGEAERLKLTFARLRENLWQRMRFDLRFFPFQSFIGIIGFVTATVIALPKYLSGQIDLSTMTRMSGAFSYVQTVLGWFVYNYTNIQHYRAVTKRLSRLDDAIAGDPDASGIHRRQDDRSDVALERLTLTTPDGRELVREVDLRLTPRSWWLVTGQPGSGKSTLAKALAGVWRYGSGSITLPRNAKVLVLSQKSYLPPGALYDALCFPSRTGFFTEVECRQALESCELGRYAELLMTMARWDRVLSSGEQQRLAIARALLHAPDWLVLDETTCGLDAASEQRVYALIKKRLPAACVVVVTHRPELLPEVAGVIALDRVPPVSAAMTR